MFSVSTSCHIHTLFSAMAKLLNPITKETILLPGDKTEEKARREKARGNYNNKNTDISQNHILFF